MSAAAENAAEPETQAQTADAPEQQVADHYKQRKAKSRQRRQRQAEEQQQAAEQQGSGGSQPTLNQSQQQAALFEGKFGLPVRRRTQPSVS